MHQAGTSRFDGSGRFIERSIPFPMPTKVQTALVPHFWSAVGTQTPPDLDGGPRANVRASSQVRDSMGLLAADFSIPARESSLLLAVAFLYNDQHDDAHDIVQDLACQEGCLLHAILHRREPDYWNAKYWFRRATDHPAYRALTPEAVALARTSGNEVLLRRLTLAGTLDPIAMVDECEAAAGNPSGEAASFLRQVQRLEFEAIVAHLLA